MAKDDLGGVWRTIGGRRVFIKDGQSISDAMKASGKFKKGKDEKEREKQDDYTPLDEETGFNPREAVDYYLKKGDFEKADELIDDYALEDERDEFIEGQRPKVRSDYYRHRKETELTNKARDQIINGYDDYDETVRNFAEENNIRVIDAEDYFELAGKKLGIKQERVSGIDDKRLTQPPTSNEENNKPNKALGKGKGKEPTFEEKREYLKQKGIDELNNFTKDDDDTFIRKEYDRQKSLENETKQAKETGKIKVDPNDRTTLNKIADSYDNIDKYEGLDDISKDYIKNRRQEMSRQEFTNKANEIHEKSLQKTIENEKTTDSDKRYNTRDVKDYQDENGTWHINDTAKNEIDKEVSMMSGKDLKEAYNSLEKNDNSYEARAIRGEYNQRQANEEKFHQTTQSMINNSRSDDDSFTMTNGSREVTVSRDDSGKWVDSDGNKYMGYLSKSDVKSYFKGDWKEAKPESTNDIMNNAIREKANERRIPGTKMKTTDEKDARNTMYKTIQSDANKRYDNKEISKEERNSIIDNAHDKFIKQKEDTKITISDALRRKAYQKYLKEHPNSKMKFEDFIKE